MMKGGIGNMMKQVQKVAEDTQRLEEELGQQRIEATSGGGMVTAAANGKGEILDIKIDPQVVDPEDVEMLQDLVLAASNEALRRAQQMVNEDMSKVTGGLQLPGMGGLGNIFG